MALQAAANQGNASEVSRLLSAGAEVDALNRQVPIKRSRLPAYLAWS